MPSQNKSLSLPNSVRNSLDFSESMSKPVVPHTNIASYHQKNNQKINIAIIPYAASELGK